MIFLVHTRIWWDGVAESKLVCLYQAGTQEAGTEVGLGSEEWVRLAIAHPDAGVWASGKGWVGRDILRGSGAAARWLVFADESSTVLHEMVLLKEAISRTRIYRKNVDARAQEALHGLEPQAFGSPWGTSLHAVVGRPTVDLVMCSRASCMKHFCQVSSKTSRAPMTTTRTWNSRNLCRQAICGGQRLDRDHGV